MDPQAIDEYRLKIKKLKHKIDTEERLLNSLHTRSLEVSRILESHSDTTLDTLLDKIKALISEKGLRMGDLFRACDPEYSDVVSIQSFVGLLRRMNVRLSQKEYEYLNVFLMPNQRMSYGEYTTVVGK